MNKLILIFFVIFSSFAFAQNNRPIDGSTGWKVIGLIKNQDKLAVDLSKLQKNGIFAQIPFYIEYDRIQYIGNNSDGRAMNAKFVYGSFDFLCGRSQGKNLEITYVSEDRQILKKIEATDDFQLDSSSIGGMAYPYACGEALKDQSFANWELVGRSNRGELFVDRAMLLRMNDDVIWMPYMVKFDKSFGINGNRSISAMYGVYNGEFDCKRSVGHYINFKWLDSDKKSTVYGGTSTVTPLEEGTSLGVAYKIACAKDITPTKQVLKKVSTLSKGEEEKLCRSSKSYSRILQVRLEEIAREDAGGWFDNSKKFKTIASINWIGGNSNPKDNYCSINITPQHYSVAAGENTVGDTYFLKVTSFSIESDGKISVADANFKNTIN